MARGCPAGDEVYAFCDQLFPSSLRKPGSMFVILRETKDLDFSLMLKMT